MSNRHYEEHIESRVALFEHRTTFKVVVVLVI